MKNGSVQGYINELEAERNALREEHNAWHRRVEETVRACDRETKRADALKERERELLDLLGKVRERFMQFPGTVYPRKLLSRIDAALKPKATTNAKV